MNAHACRVRGIAELHREKHNIVAEVGATDLHFRGDIRGFAAKDGAPGGICRHCGFARLIQQHEALYKRDAGGWRHARKRLLVASSEKTNKLGLILGATRGEDSSQRGAGPAITHRLAWRTRRAAAGLAAAVLCRCAGGGQQNSAAQKRDLYESLRSSRFHVNPLPRSISQPNSA